jgi:hypothetical protein
LNAVVGGRICRERMALTGVLCNGLALPHCAAGVRLLTCMPLKTKGSADASALVAAAAESPRSIPHACVLASTTR